MTTADIVRSFREKVGREIDLEAEGVDRYIVYTPFMFDDGDHFVVILRRENERWILTDEAHTFMHLSYSEVDLSQGTRAKIIDQALSGNRVESRAGELKLAVADDAFGDALFSLVQAISRITSTALWTYARVKSTFEEDFRALMQSVVPAERLTFDYTDPQIDPDGIYPVDCRINGMPRPCMVFAVANDAKCREATITCYHYERHERKFTSLAVFEDQTEVNRRAVAQLSDVAGKLFASLGARDRIEAYLREEVMGAGRR